MTLSLIGDLSEAIQAVKDNGDIDNYDIHAASICKSGLVVLIADSNKLKRTKYSVVSIRESSNQSNYVYNWIAENVERWDAIDRFSKCAW